MFSRFDAWIRNKLTQAVSTFVENFLKRTIREERVPNVVEQGIRTSDVKGIEDEYYIELWIDSDVAPMAAALEGDGELVRKPGTYVIRPKEKLALAFHWEDHKYPLFPSRYGKFIGQLEDGRYLFRWVEHPYVYPKRFLAKSVEQFEISLWGDDEGLEDAVLDDLFPELEL